VRIAVLGTGMVGRTLAAGLSAKGHVVTLGTRDVGDTRPRIAEWLDAHPQVALADFGAAAAASDLVINALNGAAALTGLTAAGASKLAGRILVDVANPLDFSGGFPPSLSLANTDSLGEQVQRAFPEARVVKTLNTVNCELMVDPGRLAGGAHSVFVSGDDADAKVVVTSLLHELGHADVIDLGDITTARGPEMYLSLWLRLMQALGTVEFSVRVVR
jgi:predicted dinucleotide-binding enzyme